MPNCDWYGSLEDHKSILDFIFQENECEVYELASEYEKPLKRFFSTAEVLNEFKRPYPKGNKRKNVYLQLYVLGSGPKFKPKKTKLNPSACDGATFRYNAAGWGLVQLYISVLANFCLEDPHTNHNIKKRAETGAARHKELGKPSLWDFVLIQKFSSKLNRRIRKGYVAKLGSKVVLEGAFQLWESGNILAPYKKGLNKIFIKGK